MHPLLALPLDELTDRARAVRAAAHGTRVTFSPKVFIPLTRLCRDRCGYCTFATAPARLHSPYLEPDEVLAIATRGAEAGCHEALFTLGEQPEDRYPQARSGAAYFYWLGVLKRSIARFDLILTVSEFSKTGIEEFCGRYSIK